MLFSSWLRNWKGSLERRAAMKQILRRRPPVGRHVRRLSLEVLEDRTVLSTFLVTNTGDNGGVNPAPGAGTGTLRQAIIDADAANTGTAANPDLIQFNIPTTDPGYNSTTKQFTIKPPSILPTITEPVLLDGYSQPGASPNTNPMGGADPSDNAIRLIVLDGTQASAVGQGNYDVGLLSITGANSTIRGLVVQYSDFPISILGSGSTGNVIEGNYLELEGNHIEGRPYGIVIEGASNNTIGGTDPCARNILDSSNPLLAFSGVGAQIAIFGIPSFGVAKNNIVEGNYIGLNAQGNIVATQASTGILLDGAEYTQIGGAAPAERNVVSGWDFDVFMTDNSSRGLSDTNIGNRIEGNYIGTDASGAVAVAAGTVFGNSNGGQVGLGDENSSNNLISGNLISGNSGVGLTLGNCSGEQIQNNLIGTDASGSNPLPNGEGVAIGDLIYGEMISGNTIAYNNGPGVDIAYNNGPGVDAVGVGGQIKGNSIYANAGPGVWVEADPFGANDPSGPFSDGRTTGISIQGNSIYGNSGLGIALGSIAVDLTGKPVSNPDLWDHDEPNNTVLLNITNDTLSHEGANDLQNFPVLSSASSSSTDTSISGTFSESVEQNTMITLDFYANRAADPSGYGQGQTWLGSTIVTTDANGNASFTATGLAPVPAGQGWISATATVTDPNSPYNGDTSEFSRDQEYNFSGFLPPLGQLQSYAVNRNIPIKFQLTDIFGNAVTSLGAVTALQIFNSQGVDVLNGSGAAGLSVTGSTFSYSWRTKGLAAGSYTISVTLSDGSTHSIRIQVGGNGSGANAQATDGSDVAYGSTAGQLLGGNLGLYVNNSNGDLTPDELARIQDAVSAVDTTIAPYGVSIAEVTDPTQANVTLSMGTNSPVGGYSQGILGCYTTTGAITLIQGWNWYAGADPTQIGAGQYDFQTTVTHELGHALGLGESSNSTSAMYGTLTPGTTIRALTTADLNIPYDEGYADAQRAAVPQVAPLAGVTTGTSAAIGPGTSIPSSGSPLSSTDQFFAEFAGILSAAWNAYQSELSSVTALRQTVDALAWQSLNTFLNMKAGAMGMSKDTRMGDLLFAEQSLLNGV